MNKKDLPVPAEYQESSKRLCLMWEDLVNRVEKTGNEIQNMVGILESHGYSRTKAIEKIVLDHSHLKGFSRMTIYRKLPDTMKRKYDDSTNMLPNYSDVSNDTFEEVSQQPIDLNDIISTTSNNDIADLDNQLDAQILQVKNQLLMKHLDLSDGNERPLHFVKQYTSKDKSLIREYEGTVAFEGKFIPLSIILDLTKKTIVSFVVDPVKYKFLNKPIHNEINKK